MKRWLSFPVQALGAFPFRRHRANYRAAAIKKWIFRGARHSYCSYWLAHHGNDVDRLVVLSGHDNRQTLWKHYYRACTKHQAGLRERDRLITLPVHQLFCAVVLIRCEPTENSLGLAGALMKYAAGILDACYLSRPQATPDIPRSTWMDSTGSWLMTNRQELNRRIGAALVRLKDAGFQFEYKLEWNWHLAAEKFNVRTLWQVFGLAQILNADQPLTVRGAFYRAVSSGLFPDTRDSFYKACMRLILLMRRHHLIPYDWIVDSTRRRLKPSSWTGLIDATRDAFSGRPSTTTKRRNPRQERGITSSFAIADLH